MMSLIQKLQCAWDRELRGLTIYSSIAFPLQSWENLTLYSIYVSLQKSPTLMNYDKIGMVLHLLAQRRLLNVVYCYSVQLYDYTIVPSETQFYNFHQSLYNHGPVWERMLCVICSHCRLLAVISPQAVSMYSPFQHTWVMTNIYSYIVGLCHAF